MGDASGTTNNDWITPYLEASVRSRRYLALRTLDYAFFV